MLSLQTSPTEDDDLSLIPEDIRALFGMAPLLYADGHDVLGFKAGTPSRFCWHRNGELLETSVSVSVPSAPFRVPHTGDVLLCDSYHRKLWRVDSDGNGQTIGVARESVGADQLFVLGDETLVVANHANRNRGTKAGLSFYRPPSPTDEPASDGLPQPLGRVELDYDFLLEARPVPGSMVILTTDGDATFTALGVARSLHSMSVRCLGRIEALTAATPWFCLEYDEDRLAFRSPHRAAIWESGYARDVCGVDEAMARFEELPALNVLKAQKLEPTRRA